MRLLPGIIAGSLLLMAWLRQPRIRRKSLRSNPELGKPARDDLAANIPHLTSCTDDPDHALHLKLNQPITVLVHGCFGSSGEFRGLISGFGVS